MTPLRAAIVACSGAFCASLSTSLVTIAAPVVAQSLGKTQGEVAWVLTAYLLAISCLLALSGRLADLFGRRRIVIAGFAIFTVGAAACVAAPTLALLVGARVVQGIGASMLMATGPALITGAFPPERRGRALGIQLATTYVGLTIGPTLGGWLASTVDWHAIFAVVAALGAVGTALAAALLEPDSPRSQDSRIDWVGAALFAAGLAAILLGLRRGGAGAARPDVGASLVVGAIALGLFVRQESRHAAPLLPLGLLRTPRFAFGVAGATLLYVVTFVLAFLLPFHLEHTRGIDAKTAGFWMTAQPITMAVVAPISGLIADRFGPRFPTTSGMLLIGAGLALVERVVDGSGVLIAAALAVVGAGAGLYVAPNSAVIMAAAPRDRQGTAAAMAATARNVGMATGVALAVVLRDAVGTTRALTVAAGLAIAGALLSALR